jgi:Na+-transporting methylmalonyl-CoA/oxaloacetate decarboxylase gamma subunit
MRMRGISIVLSLLLLTACGVPSMSSALRSNYPGDIKLEMKCELYEQENDRDVKDLNAIMSKYYNEGWRLAAMSEYTSSMVFSFKSFLCFERPVK